MEHDPGQTWQSGMVGMFFVPMAGARVRGLLPFGIASGIGSW